MDKTQNAISNVDDLQNPFVFVATTYFIVLLI